MLVRNIHLANRMIAESLRNQRLLWWQGAAVGGAVGFLLGCGLAASVALTWVQ